VIKLWSGSAARPWRRAFSASGWPAKFSQAGPAAAALTAPNILDFIFLLANAMKTLLSQAL
jgi:hypothetical protein